MREGDRLVGMATREGAQGSLEESEGLLRVDANAES